MVGTGFFMAQQNTEHSELVYMDTERVMRTLKRMAYQIAESNRENRQVILLGIEKRGYTVAQQLKVFLEEIYGQSFPLVRVTEGMDLEQDPGITASKLQEAYLLLVDDVIFSGQTMFTALNRVYEVFRFNEIHTAVLVDRGHRRFPIQAQFVGLELSTKLKEHVSVILQEEKIQKVVLRMN